MNHRAIITILAMALYGCTNVTMHVNPVSYEEVQSQCSKYLGDDQEYYGCAIKALGNCVVYYFEHSNKAKQHEIVDCVSTKINHGDEL